MLNEITFATFAVKVAQVFREEASIVYVEGDREWRFPAERTGSGWRSLDILIDGSAFVEETPRIVTNLRIALDRLGYGYVIRRELPPLKVPDAERDAAIAELRAKGFKLRPRSGKVPEHWMGGTAIADLLRVAGLVAAAKGIRTQYEVLAKSLDEPNDR
jgi:hypothetical protein